MISEPTALDGDRRHLLAQTVYEELFELLRTPEYMQRRAISDSELAKRFGVSRTPVRTALARLECDGLVQRTRGRGWAIVRITVRDIARV